MSTKVYNGFKFRDPDLFAVHRDLNELKEFIRAAALVETADHIRQAAISELDNSISKDTTIEPRLIGRMTMKMFSRQQEVKKTQRRDPEVDMEFEIVILPDLEQRALYGIFYTERRTWGDHVRSLPWYIDYSYWNNTDRPDDVTDAEWEERSETWDRVCGWTPPSKRGYTMSVDTDMTFSDKLIDIVFDPTKIPDIPTRARDQALKDARGFYFDQNYDSQTMHRAMEVLIDARKWIDTQDGQDFVHRRETDLAPMLLPFDKSLID